MCSGTRRSTIFCCIRGFKSTQNIARKAFPKRVAETKKGRIRGGRVVTAIAEKGCSGHFAAHIAKACFSARSWSSSVRTSRRKLVLLEILITTGNSIVGGREFERAAIDLDDLAKRRMPVLAVALSVDDLAFVKSDICQMHVGFDHQQAGHLCALDNLHGVEDADIAEISRKSDIGADLLRRTVAVDGKIGASGTTYGFQAGCNRNSRIEQLGFLQAIICQIKILAADIQAHESEALPGRFV